MDEKVQSNFLYLVTLVTFCMILLEDGYTSPSLRNLFNGFNICENVLKQVKPNVLGILENLGKLIWFYV